MNLITLIPYDLRQHLKLWWKRKTSVPDEILSFQKLKANGFSPKQVIDVGAYKGEFAVLSKRFFPDASILMVEPQADKQPILKDFCAQYPDCQNVQALAGAENKDGVPFFLQESNSHVPVSGPIQGTTMVRQQRLDDIASDKKFASAEFLKLDVQGYELEVLKGAPALLSRVEVVYMEVALIPIGGVPIFNDVQRFMDEHGFRLYDICTFFYRPCDRALWQVDVIFVAKSSKLIENNLY